MRSCVLIVLGVCTFHPAVSAEPLRHVRIDTKDARTLASELERAGFDIPEGFVTDTSVELIVSAPELERLQEQGYAPVTLAIGRPFQEIQAEPRAPGAVPPGYLNLTEIVAEMNAAAAAFPSICQVVDLTGTYGTPPTFEGRHIHAVRISDNVAQDEDEPAFLMVSDHHAREIVTPVLALYAIDRLTTQYGSDPTITDLVDSYEIWIAPVWNPDGYEYVFNVDNLWRKNRRVFPTGIGVDLNRNYPFGWSSACSGSTDPSSSTYKGPSAASEAETQTMIALSNDRRFAKVLDYHSSGREVLWGYACHSHPLASFLQSEATALSSAAGYGGSIRSPSAEGEHYEWQLALNAAHAFLMETHTEFQPSYASAQAEAALVWPGTVWLMERPIPLSGHVTDALNSAPLQASITYPAIDFQNGETNGSGGSFGRYHAFLPTGRHLVEFAAEGYFPQSHLVSVTSPSPSVLDVALDRACAAGDLNCDSTVDLDDYAILAGCLSGPGGGIPPGCALADLDGDGAVALSDFAEFELAFTGSP